MSWPSCAASSAPPSVSLFVSRLRLPDDADPRIVRALRIHGALDLGFAALYAWLGFVVAPGRSRAFDVALLAVVALLTVAGATLLGRLRLARRIALVAQTLLALFAVTCIVLLVASAAYLRGIYGPVGQGLALVALVVGALIVELCGLLPLFQLRLLLGDEVSLLFLRG